MAAANGGVSGDYLKIASIAVGVGVVVMSIPVAGSIKPKSRACT